MSDRISQDLESVRPEQALAWINERSYDKQRRVRQANVDFLASHMLNDTFKVGTQIVFARLKGQGNNRYRLINGQHTLRAICKSKTTQLLSIMYHEMDTEDEIKWLYTREDRQRTRNVFDTYNALELLEQMELSTKTQLKSTGTAVKTIMAGFSRPKGLVRDEVFITEMLKYKSAANLYFPLVTGIDNTLRQSFYRSTTLSIALAVCRDAPKVMGLERVESFWTGAAQDDGLCAGDARKTLLYHLRSHILGSQMSDRKRVPLRYAILWVAECWNAWAEDRSLPLEIAVDDLGGQMHIINTPWVRH